MKILLTGATGFIGKRLLPLLIQEGHEVICLVREKHRFIINPQYQGFIHIYEGDLLVQESLNDLPVDIDVAFYLVHSMSSNNDFEHLEKISAENFSRTLSRTKVKQVIYLGGISNQENLSKHLKSRKMVEDILKQGNFALTVLRAGIIVGSGSASFEIIRDLTEKLPFMICPKWVNTKCQPIAIANVLEIMIKVVGLKEAYNQTFDIGGPDILTYKEMLLGYAKVRNLKRWIVVVPFMTPRLSSYWLYFVTSVSFNLAKSLVDSMKVQVVCSDLRIQEIVKYNPISYEEAIQRALDKIEKDEVISSWHDALISSTNNIRLYDFIEVPVYGCYKDIRKAKIRDKNKTIEKIWKIGGNTGYYYANFLWEIRGFIDKVFGGTGLNRGRTRQNEIYTGDTIDFWRVLYANKDEGRLILFAEMKLPGEAWLEFKINDDELYQIATFRPKGLFGRIYWYSILPFHEIIFKGMIHKIAE